MQLLGLMVATSFVVATLLTQCFSRIDVATTVSLCDLVVFPFSWFLSYDLSSELGLLFLIELHVATSVLCSDHISVSTALLLVVTFFFWSRPCWWFYAFTSFKFKSRPQGDVATSFDVHFPSSSRNFNFFVATNFFFPTSMIGCDLKVMSRPHVSLYLVACSPNCSKVVATWISSTLFFFRLRPERVVATLFVVLD